MLTEIQPNLRKLTTLVRMIENFDATVAAARAAGKPINLTQAALGERKRMEPEAAHLRTKWAI